MTTVYLVEKSSSFRIPEIIYMYQILMKRKIWYIDKRESSVFQLMFFFLCKFFVMGKKIYELKKMPPRRLTQAVSKTKHAIKSFWTEFFLLSDNKKNHMIKEIIFCYTSLYTYRYTLQKYKSYAWWKFSAIHIKICHFLKTGPGPCLM